MFDQTEMKTVIVVSTDCYDDDDDDDDDDTYTSRDCAHR